MPIIVGNFFSEFQKENGNQKIQRIKRFFYLAMHQGPLHSDIRFSLTKSHRMYREWSCWLALLIPLSSARRRKFRVESSSLTSIYMSFRHWSFKHTDPIDMDVTRIKEPACYGELSRLSLHRWMEVLLFFFFFSFSSHFLLLKSVGPAQRNFLSRSRSLMKSLAF